MSAISTRTLLGMALAAGVTSRLIYLIWKKQLLSKSINLISKAFIRAKPSDDLGSQSTIDSSFQYSFFYQILIFPDGRRACKNFFWGGGCQYENCWESHEENSTSTFISHILSARRTLDVCVYVITDSDLADYVISMRAKGVLVRVITNMEAQNYTGTQIGKFRASGIQVRLNHKYLMHHKFLLVDKKKVLSGSFNWTSQATTANNENMIVTDNPQIVQPFVQEFDKLWKQFGSPSLASWTESEQTATTLQTCQ